MQALGSSNSILPYDYRMRLEPRFQAWLSTPGIPKSPEKTSLIFEIYQQINFFSWFNTKQSLISFPITPLNIIIKHISSTSDLRAWRLQSKLIKEYIDTDGSILYWKRVEAEMMEKELPELLLKSFGGVKIIQDLPFIQFSSESFRAGLNLKQRKPELKNRINWVKPEDLHEGISRGMDPNGSHFICFKIFNYKISKTIVMTIHESSPAFLKIRSIKTIAWVASNSLEWEQKTLADGELYLLNRDKIEKTYPPSCKNLELIVFSKYLKRLIEGDVVTTNGLGDWQFSQVLKLLKK